MLALTMADIPPEGAPERTGRFVRSSATKTRSSSEQIQRSTGLLTESVNAMKRAWRALERRRRRNG